MLEPSSRRLLMESLQPPAGYRLVWAVGTTYTLDLMALLSAPVAFAFSDYEDRDGRPTCDPLALLKAVRQYAGQVCLFCQAGKIQVPKAYQPLLASVEDSIYQANAPSGGSFHPKMWFLRFVDRDDENVIQYRVLCASRNMTFNRSWDTLLCLEGELQDRTNAFSKNHPLGKFVEALPTMIAQPMAQRWKGRLKQLAYEIRRVDFEVPAPFAEVDYWPLGIGLPDRWPFPERIDRLFVVSPFVDDGLISDLNEWEAPIQLVSRADRLGRLDSATIESLEKVYVLDDTAVPETGDSEEEIEELSGSTSDVQETGDIPLVGLHAKVYVVDEGWNARVFTGSANATRAGFNRNVEFLIELQGKKSRCGIDALLGQSADEKKRASCLADLLQPYVPIGDEEDYDPKVDEFERSVDQLAKELTSAVPQAICTDAPTEGMFTLEIVTKKRLKLPANLANFCVTARPASVLSSQLSIMDLGQKRWGDFPNVTLLGLTSFFVFEVESKALNIRRQFVLNVPLVDAPENRHEAILRDLLSDRDRVLRFLMLLLLDTGARDLSQLMESDSNGEASFSFVHSMLGETLFEALMKALGRDPERLEQIAEVIADLTKTDDGKKLIPKDFNEIWEPIWQVREGQIQSKHQKRKTNK